MAVLTHYLVRTLSLVQQPSLEYCCLLVPLCCHHCISYSTIFCLIFNKINGLNFEQVLNDLRLLRGLALQRAQGCDKADLKILFVIPSNANATANAVNFELPYWKERCCLRFSARVKSRTDQLQWFVVTAPTVCCGSVGVDKIPH